jgi:hypothetical protein
MRLTSFTDFALRALTRLAGEPARSFATSEIAAEFGISRNHLAKNWCARWKEDLRWSNVFATTAAHAC